jgi:hypothetical protein
MTGRPAPGTPLGELCAALCRLLCDLYPRLCGNRQLPAGQPGEPVPVEHQNVNRLVATALRQAVGTDLTGHAPADEASLPRVVVWTDGVAELAVELAAVTTETADGQVTVVIPVRCDQLPDQRGTVRARFAVGTQGRPAGLLAATPREPDGPALVVRLWGDALVALAWRALLDAAAGIAGAAGSDPDGTPLVVTAITASQAGLQVLPQARHPFDRVSPPRAVVPR